MSLQKIHNLSLSTSKIEKTQKIGTSNLNQQALDFVLQAIQDNPNLKNNRQFMLDAIKNVLYFIHKASPYLQNDSNFLAKAQEANPHLKEDQLFMIMRLGSFGA